MNISISSYVFNRGNRPIQISNALIKSLYLTKFFVSCSKISMIKSSNNALERFKLYNSAFNKYLSPVVCIRSDSSYYNKEHYFTVERTTFKNAKSVYQGSALCCKQGSMKVCILSCRFANCTSTCISSSYQRDSAGTSGGACFFSVCEVIMKSCSFESCIGAALGSAVYVSTPKEYSSNISCMCDINCGNNITSIHSIYAYETTKLKLSDLNSTNSISKNMYGTFHIGMYPLTFNAQYFSIIMKPNENIAIPIGMSVTTDKTGYLNHAYIANGNDATGLISTWLGHYVINDIVFNECSGNILRERQSIQSISFNNTVFSPSMTLNRIITDSSCTITNKEIVILIKCVFKFNNISCKRHIYHNALQSIYFVFLIML